jgi:RNA polymerase sigma factor (sigma-70 family)
MTQIGLNLAVRHLRALVETRDLADAADGDLLERFARRRDEAAFAMLLRRHGPMVLAVGRRIVRQVQDAEDVFQAAFLLLARQAHTIRKRESVGCWLHGVAQRLALRLRSQTIQRSQRERQAAAMRETVPSDAAWRELQSVLDEELARLPANYRAAVVACCLEGKTQEEAAGQLGCPLGTVRSRLARGRKLLHARLTRRGLTLSAAALATALTASAATNAVAAALVRVTHQSALRIAAGQTASATVPLSVVALVESGMKTLTTTKVQIATVILLASGLLGGIVWSQAAVGWVESSKPTVGEAVGLEDSTHPTRIAEEAKTDQHDEPLPADALVRLGTTRLRHGDNLDFLQFTSDGKVLVGRGNGGVRTWETATGNRIHIFPKESEGGIPAGASLSPDGKLIATPAEKSLRIWEMATAKLLRTIPIDTGRVIQGQCLFTCFSRDGKLLASQNSDQLNQVSLWDPATGRHVRTWTAGKRWIKFLAFADDDKTLITANDTNSICAWDVTTGKNEREIASFSNPIQTLALSPDGKLLATVGYVTKPPKAAAAGGGFVIDYIPEPFIHIWDVATGKEVRRFVEPAWEKKAEEKRGFRSLAFVSDGKTLLAATYYDGALYACTLAGAKEPRRVWRSSAQISAVAASPDGKTAAVATGSTVHLIDLASGKDISPITAHPQHVYKTAITPDGRTIITASGADLYLWDAASSRLRKRLQGHNDYINGLELIDGGRKAVTSAYQEGNLRVWDLIAEKEAYRIESSDKMNILQAVSPDGKTIAVGGSNSLTVLFDARTGKEIQRLEGHGKFNDYGAAFTPDGRMLVVWYCEDNMVYLWDLASSKKVREYAFIDGDPPLADAAGGRPVYFAAVSPDGRLIVFGSQSRLFEVRDLLTGEVLYRETKLPDGVCPVTFSPDSRLLAWSGWWNDPTVHVVEIATGKDRRRFAGHTGRVLSLSFSADGTKLISGSGDTTALVWDLTGKRTAPADWARPLSAEDLQVAWDDLASDDSAHAFDTIRRLSAAPHEPIAFFRQHLKPVAATDEKRLARMIADLDSDEFTVREKANQDLEALGEAAVAACRTALKGNPSTESRRRLERLLSEQIRDTARPSPERLRTLRALEVLERAGTPEARQLLTTLAKGAPGAWLTREARTALERNKPQMNADKHR